MINSKISVIIPAFDAEKFISKTIQSVINQTFRDFELIVIDDGSTDLTLDIVSRFIDQRIKVYSFPNRGVSVSRNEGARITSSEYISFLDSDDLWAPDKLSVQLDTLEKNDEVAAVYSFVDCVNESDEIVRRGVHYSANGDVYEKLIADFFIGNGSNLLIKREAFDDVGGFDESINHAEDWEFSVRLANRHDFACVPQVQIYYRQTYNSVSTDTSKMEKGHLKVVDKIFSTAPSYLFSKKKKSIAMLYNLLCYRVFYGRPLRRKMGFQAVKYLLLWSRHEPKLVIRKLDICAILFLALTVILLPSKLAEIFIKKMQFLYRRHRDRYYLKMNKIISS